MTGLPISKWETLFWWCDCWMNLAAPHIYYFLHRFLWLCDSGFSHVYFGRSVCLLPFCSYPPDAHLLSFHFLSPDCLHTLTHLFLFPSLCSQYLYLPVPPVPCQTVLVCVSPVVDYCFLSLSACLPVSSSPFLLNSPHCTICTMSAFGSLSPHTPTVIGYELWTNTHTNSIFFSPINLHLLLFYLLVSPISYSLSLSNSNMSTSSLPVVERLLFLLMLSLASVMARRSPLLHSIGSSRMAAADKERERQRR